VTRTVTDRATLDQTQAEAIKYLLDITELETALALGHARLARIEINEGTPSNAVVYLSAPAEAREILDGEAEWIVTDDGESGGPTALIVAFSVTNALNDVTLYPDITIGADLREVPRHQGTAREPGKYEYRGLRYRSQTETRVAEALDEANVLYFPLPLGVRHYQRIAEPDFLVVTQGKVGVLEIDGPHHTPLTRAQEAAKDAKLLQSGVRLVHHASVNDVDRDVTAVVKEFLTLLRGPIL
jgi:hypothetical protein